MSRYSFGALGNPTPTIGTNMDFNTIGFPQPYNGSVPGLSTFQAPGQLTMPGDPSGFFSKAGIGGGGIGFNSRTLGAGLTGLQTIGGIWAALGQQKAMKKQLKFAVQSANTNNANQVASYNTAIGDRAAALASATRKGDTPADLAAAGQVVANYNDKNRLTPAPYGKG